MIHPVSHLMSYSESNAPLDNVVPSLDGGAKNVAVSQQDNIRTVFPSPLVQAFLLPYLPARLAVASALPLIPKCVPFLLMVCSNLQFATADGIREQLSGEQKKIPPPVLQENGHINKEYFRVLAEKGGAFVTNIPPSFPEDHDGQCISMCVLVPPSRLRL